MFGQVAATQETFWLTPEGLGPNDLVIRGTGPHALEVPDVRPGPQSPQPDNLRAKGREAQFDEPVTIVATRIGHDSASGPQRVDTTE